MYRFLSLLVFSLLLSLASASTAGIQKRSFSVKRVPNPTFTGRDGPKALAKAYRKYNAPLPHGLQRTLEARQSTLQQHVSNKRSYRVATNPHVRGSHYSKMGSHAYPQVQAQPYPLKNMTNQTGVVEASPEKGDVEFLSPVKIGGQMLTLDFDTGSSDLWVFNSQLGKDKTAGHQIYDPKKSKTFTKMKGHEFRIRYGDGSGARGNVGTDVVEVGGATVSEQPVQLATEVTGTFLNDQSNDGLMGLAFSKLNTVKPNKQKTFFENVKDSLSEPLFTADLRKGSTGAYNFGHIDHSRFKGDLHWLPINETKGFWQFSSERFALDDQEPQPSTPGAQAIVDTGTTLILADEKIATAYYSQIEGAQQDDDRGGYTFPCEQELPDLHLDIGGVYMARVAGSDLNFSETGNNMCFGGIQAAPRGGVGIYGDIFLKSHFVVFHGGNNSLGIAPHA
ncbi:hypothetical protein CDD81_2352 [Ophiocordyceps australis]|uniref:Peptidase A1 domain-containing protein n=1 Tax=Ophiocordyceps australis TaxID=1399860 RepID=A0A2C5XX40_9HYPO|nr:hypothetical protein CDD81_2352 [Ophiocordyceps australis]